MKERLGEIEREIVNLVQAIGKMGISPALQARLKDAEEECARLRRRSPTQARKRVDSEAAITIYKQLVMRLQQELAADVPRARNALAEILGDVRLSKEGEEV